MIPKSCKVWSGSLPKTHFKSIPQKSENMTEKVLQNEVPKTGFFYVFGGSEPQGAPWESQGPTQGANSRPKNTKMTQKVLQTEVPKTKFFMFEGSGPQGAPWGSQGATQDANSQPKKYQNGVPKPTQISENRSKTNPIVSFVCLSSLCFFTCPKTFFE